MGGAPPALGHGAPGLRGPLLAGLLLALAVLGAHGTGLRNGFAYDDEPVVVENAIVSDASLGIGEVVSRPWWRLDEDRGVLWRPTAALALRAQWALGGGSPLPFHAVNLLLALLTAGLVAGLAVWATGRGWASVAGALVFAVHPVHVEAVANVVGQAELWAALFTLIGLWVALWEPARTGKVEAGDGAAESGAEGGVGGGDRTGRWRAEPRRALQVLAVAGAYGLALGAKEIAVTMPAMLVLLRVAREGRMRLKDDLALHLAMAAVLAAYLVLRAWVLGGVVGEDLAPPFRGVDGLGRVWTALSVLPFAWLLLAAPFRLSADYDPGHLPVVDFPAIGGWVGLLIGASLLVLAVRLLRAGGHSRVAGAGMLWVMAVRLPVSNLLIPTGVLLAERTLYLPSVGVALVVAAAVARLREGRTASAGGSESPGEGSGASGEARARGHAPVGGATRGRRIATALVGVVVLVFAARSALRTPVWRSTFTVMASLGTDAPASWRALRTLAVGRLNRGDVEGGLEAMGVAFETLPWRYDLATEYGLNLSSAGRYAEAREVLDWTVTHWPDRVEGHNVLAEMLLVTRAYEEAWQVSVEAIRRTGGNGRTWGLLSEAHLAADRLDAALRARRASVALDPDDAASRERLAELERVVRQIEAARREAGGA